MRRFQDILYATSGVDDEIDSLKQALSVARNNSAALHAVAFSPMLPRRLAEYQAGYETSLRDRLKTSTAQAQAALQMDARGVQVSVDVECGDNPAARMVRRVLRNSHDLLIKQTEPADRRVGFRALDMQLLRLCPCPVWLCRPIGRSRTEIRVAVAIDAQSLEPAGRDLALQLLRLARALADTCSAELDIVSCWDFEFEDYLRHSPWIQMPEPAIAANVNTADRDHQAALGDLVHESGIGGRIRVHRPRGNPEQEIPRLAEDLEVDILVMGTVARTGIPGFGIGNTADNILADLKCSLLALKPNGFVSSVRAY
jgi:nucleotide-binding universal stress UspA family protein